MKYSFEYRFGYKLIYSFGSLIINLLLIMYLIPALMTYEGKFLQVLYVFTLLFFLFFFNRYYFNLYKIMPYKIEADEEKIVCSHFMFGSKIHTIRFDEVDKLSGGIFDGKATGLMKVHNRKEGITIGFFHKINDARTLETLILSKVSKQLYDEVIDKFNIKKASLRKRTK
jgi:hypothetical protein